MRDAVRFWGVRGSIATPGDDTARVGGNTSCVEVRLAGELIILDAGTGLRALGASLGPHPLEATLLLGHLHWDHIQGLPFFAPLFVPATRLRIVGPEGTGRALEGQMSAPGFPITMADLAADVVVEEIAPGAEIAVGSVAVRTGPLRHPGGGIGYRLEAGGTSVVYACDTEPPSRGQDPAVVGLATEADLLVFDAQYLPEEYPSRIGFGHSTYAVACEVARRAGVGRLLLTHHDPHRDDAAVAAIESRARAIFGSTEAAREGRAVDLARRTRAPGADGSTDDPDGQLPSAAA